MREDPCLGGTPEQPQISQHQVSNHNCVYACLVILAVITQRRTFVCSSTETWIELKFKN